MTKFYIDTFGPHVEDIAKAFKFAISIAKRDKEIKRIIFYSYTKTNFMQVDKYFEDVHRLQLPDTGVKIQGMNVLVKCETKITYRKQYSYGTTDIVIACHMDSKDIYVLDDDAKAKYIIAIPWIEHGVDEWVRRWFAKEISGKATVDTKEASVDPLLSVALKEMDILMFETKSLSHQSDEETCKTYIRTIHKYMPNVTPTEIENYLVRNLSWTSANANEVGNLLARLKEGRTFKGGAKTGLQNYFKGWKAKA